MASEDYELHRGDELYPHVLEDLEHPPERLYVRGNPEIVQKTSISVVGARNATPYGIATSMMAGRIAAECALTVVSGGARGCDAAAARAALDAGGTTVIVAGTGADGIYPASSRDIFERALAGAGAVVSLEPWGSGPRRWTFTKRNYVIAALGRALFVCEAGIRSGTSSTAEVAARLGRQLYAVPGSIFSPQSAGTNRLIADGAAIVCSEGELESMISLDYGRLRHVPEGSTRTEGRVLSALLASPARADDLASLLGEDPLTLLRTLSDYETQGLIVRMRDGRYAPSEDYLMVRARMNRDETHCMGES
jgi:DNA processing protein